MDIRFHGRGGQGTVMAAKILADAVLRSGRGECMAIPEFGVERRGAPVAAFARISDRKILVRSRIYDPDAVVLLDPVLASDPNITKGLKPGGLLLMNSEQEPAALASRWPDSRIVTIPARRIALAHRLGCATSPVVNTAMCGALIAALDVTDLPSLEGAIRDSVPGGVEANIEAAREAYRLCLEKYGAAA